VTPRTCPTPRTYLDHAATSVLRPEVRDVVTALLGHAAGNPSSLHGTGRAARRVVEQAREDVADAVGAGATEVVFTAGGTEADNLAVKGIALARRAADPRRRRLLVSAVEHHAVLDPAHWLAGDGSFEVVQLPVDATGRLRVDALAAAVVSDPGSVALVSVMAANNEVGTYQPLDEVVAVCEPAGIPVHADAVQALGVLDLDFAGSGLAAMSLTGHKAGGPVGAGALVLRHDVEAVAVLHGGGQQRDLRSGTLDAVGVGGFAAAASLAAAGRDAHVAHLVGLRARLVTGALAAVSDAVLVGPADPTGALPGLAWLSFPGADAEAVLFALDERGLDVSAGSACSAGIARVSHVLTAMGRPADEAPDGIRVSLGWSSTAADVDALLAALPDAVATGRAVAEAERVHV